jgi:hypothetical protein
LDNRSTGIHSRFINPLIDTASGTPAGHHPGGPAKGRRRGVNTGVRRSGRPKLQVGSEEHKRLFCQSFIDSHKPFEPDEIVWPQLDGETLARLHSLPIWNEAVRTEAATALEVQTLGNVEQDSLLAQAISLQGYEESRHAAVLRLLTAHYGIEVDPFPEPAVPKNPTWRFVKTGYGECLDSFFAFGLFAIGKRSQFFPDALIDIFDPIMQEEARHILFLVNWVAYLRARTRWFARPLFEARRTAAVAGQIVEHARHAASFGRGESQEGFSMKGHAAFEDLSTRDFFELCLAENDRRLALYDPRLLRPALVPTAIRRVIPLLSRRSRRPGRVAASDGEAKS